MICAEARVYAGAVADGEVELVPAAAAEHVADCQSCGLEVEWQRAGHISLAAALADEARVDATVAGSRDGGPVAAAPTARSQRRWSAGPLAATAVAAVILLAVGLGAVILSPSDRPVAAAPDVAMADAVHSFGAAAEYTSADQGAVNGWGGTHGDAMPAMAVTGASCTGARTTQVGGRGAVTYLYKGASGPIEVSAIPGGAPGDWPRSETRMMNGMAVGMVHHGNQGLIVVAGDESQLMQFISQIQ